MASFSAKPAPASSVTTRRVGQHYEHYARHHLQQQGLHFVAANVYLYGGELDLIMRDGQQWVFVEVRYRKNADFGGATASISRSKRQNLRQLANQWLLRHNCNPYHTSYRFDVLAITGNQIHWLVNAFGYEE